MTEVGDLTSRDRAGGNLSCTETKCSLRR